MLIVAAVVVVVAIAALVGLRGGSGSRTAEVIPSQPAGTAAVPATPAPAAPAPAPAATPAQTAAAPAAAPAARPEPGAPRTTEDMLKDRVLGSPDAAVTIIEYASLTCPHCAAFHANTLPELKKRYVDTGKVRIIFRDFPFDAAALRASMLARCAAPERYFGVLDVLFRSQETWSRAQDPLKALSQTGRLAGVGQQEFDACMANEALLNGIVNIRMEGEQRFQVNSTPTFVFRRGDREEKFSGAQSIDRFAEVLGRLGA
ncbi:DsbA family protein [Arenibaculum pallidiluteum]|uniref:DsbA family protein n=1 Tax=Arenibaculum pallidiluteum TaxID=2812559 RepID=UPI001F3592E9|nr:DsbA family protein [Arenibaculum pallidiluteum]